MNETDFKERMAKAEQCIKDIESLNKNIIKIKNDIEELRLQLDNRKSSLMKTIRDEVDDNGKPKYSNEAKRSYECERRLQDDFDYITANGKLEKLKSKKDDINIELDSKLRWFSLDKIQLKFITLVLNIL